MMRRGAPNEKIVCWLNEVMTSEAASDEVE